MSTKIFKFIFNSVLANTLVFDSEGINWEERSQRLGWNKEQIQKFDRTITWFSLCISDVLLINVEWCQIGQLEGNCFEVFKSITEAYKELFIEDETHKKTIIFTFRKYNEREYTKECVIKRVESKLKSLSEEDSDIALLLARTI